MLNRLQTHYLLWFRNRPWLTKSLICAGILAILFIASVFIPLTRNLCTYNDHTNNSECAYHHLGPFALLWFVEIVNQYNAFVTAVATIVMAIFTGTLWVTSKGQAALTRESIDLGREEFISTHRPRIVLREAFTGTFLQGERIAVFFHLANIGETAGRIIRSRAEVEIVRKDGPGRLLLQPSLHDKNDIGTVTLGPGESRLFRATKDSCPPWEQQMFEMREGCRVAVIHLSGQVMYTDAFGHINRRTAFRRELVPEKQRFYRIPDEPDLDYAD
jgi:hypothetical protein